MRILSISNRLAALRTRINDTFTLPERFKGTFVEKWANYWRGLLSDYGEVTIGVIKEAKNKPRKALLVGGVSYGLYACARRNPDEEDFMDQLRSYDNRMILIPPTLQNPKSAKYLQEMETALNQQRLRTFSLGVCTLIWLDIHDRDDCTYPAICKHTGVGYWNFHERIVDIGFWNRFWRLDWEMINSDVNYL